VGSYAEFLPWCRAARVLEQENITPTEQSEAQGGGGLEVKASNHYSFLGELVICYKHFCESYTSRVVLMPPNEKGNCAIDVTMVKGPFEYLTNNWKFTEVAGGTKVDFVLDFKFRSKILDKLMGAFFTRATQKMVGAFKDRAQVLYGE
jgi:coenzyme Q-binding protein COQ10